MMGVIVGTICCMISGATVWGGFGIVDGAVHRTAIMEGLLLGVYLGGGIGVIVGMIVGMVMGGILGASARGVPLNEQAENRRTIMPPFAWILVGAIVGTFVGAVAWGYDGATFRGIEFAKWSKIEIRNWAIGTAGGSVGGIATGAVLGFVRHYSRLGL